MISSPLRSSSGRDSERGVVFIIILWVSLGLACLALLFGQSMMMEYRSADNSVAGLQAEQTIEGAVRYAMYALANVDEAGTPPTESDLKTEWVSNGDSYFWVLGRDLSNSKNNKTPTFGLVDECSKLNLNTATQDMLELLPGMTSALAASIIDWRDEDSDVTDGGAESESYQMRNPSYPCKDASFESIDEMRLLIGASMTLLEGEDYNRNGILDLNENDGTETLPQDNQDSQLDPGIFEYVTVFSNEPNTASISTTSSSYSSSSSSSSTSSSSSSSSSSSTTKINITSSEEELVQLLQEEFSEDRATEIQGNYGTLSDITSLMEFYILSKMTASEFAKIDGRISISDEAQEGLININTASEAVLACIPGIGTENAGSVVTYRKSHSSSLDSIAWLAEVLEDDSAIEAGPYITSYSYQYTADIVAVGHDGKGYRRIQFVIDTSEETPVIRFRRDLTRYGWALGREIRNELTSLKESLP